MSRHPASPLPKLVALGVNLTGRKHARYPLAIYIEGSRERVAIICADREEATPRQIELADAITHAVNAYPRLVETLLSVMGLVQLLGHDYDSRAVKNHRYLDAVRVLRELGEAA